MAQSDPLAQLRDIHLPEPIGFWPLAPGWWLLIALSVVLISVVSWRFWRAIVAARAKKEALRLLKYYEEQSLQEGNSAPLCAQISELLRRVALAYFPRKEVASVHGVAWIEFLNKHGKKVDFNAVRSLLLDSAYQAHSQERMQPLIRRARRWIQQRRMQ